MIIPPQPLSFYLSESDRKPFSEERQATPVDSAAKLRAALSEDFPEQRKAFTAKNSSAGKITESPEQKENRRQSHGKRDGQNSSLRGVQDRRQEERRKQKQPTLLDTRLTRRRRETNRGSVISLEI